MPESGAARASGEPKQGALIGARQPKIKEGRVARIAHTTVWLNARR